MVVKKKVLVIDDQKEICELVSVTLRNTEFDVTESNTGIDGIQKARDIQPDLILLDIMMPEFDGFMTCKALKQYPETENIPVIFVTAKVSKAGRQISVKSGAIDFISKPFDPDMLLKKIRLATI